MVKTRGVKPSKTLAELDLDLLNRMEDLELWEAEKSEPKNGNARCNSKLDASLDQIPPEILTNVVEFMNDVRDIYHLSITSKSFRESVSDTAIMRACIFSAGTTTKNKTQKHTPLILSNLMEKMTTIRPPSTLRLLRLVNAKRCERGDVCFGYNSKLKTAMPLRDNTMTKRPFGMALCTTCVSNLSSKKTILWSSPRDPLMRARIAHEQDTYLLHAAEEQATKEAIGPYVLALGVSQIKYSYNVREERTQAVEALLATVHEGISKKERTRTSQLVDMYSMTKTDFLASEERKEIMKSDKRLERIRNKRARVDLWLSKAEELLEGYEHKEFVLLGDWDETTGERDFRYVLSNATIGRLLRAPSQCTDEKMKAQVTQAKEAYDLLFSHGFGTNNPADFLAFLSDSDDPAIKVLFEDRDSFGVEWVQRDRFYRIFGTLSFVQTIREEGPLAAFLPHVWGKLKGIFARTKIPANNNTRFKILVESVWGFHNPIFGGPRTPTEWKNAYEICGREYRVLRSRLVKYMKRNDYIEFMAETSVPASHRSLFNHRNITRRSVMKAFFELKHGSHELLKAEKYEELLALHKVLFLNPQMQHRYF